MGPAHNIPSRRATVIAKVAVSAEKIDERIDLAKGEMQPTAGLDSLFTPGNYPALWRIQAIYCAAVIVNNKHGK